MTPTLDIEQEPVFKDNKSGRLRKAVYERWQQHEEDDALPTSGRFLFYELVQAGIISKTKPKRTDGRKGRRPDQDMSDALTVLREEGYIPWNDIVDETRDLTQWQVYNSIKDAMRDKW